MKSFLKKREIRITRRQAVIAAIAVVVLVAIYWFVTHRPAPAPDLPVVAVEPVIQDDVEIYGEYVGRVRAQQFVEVRARVEGYLENMLFEEGTYVTKNQVLFVINRDQYAARADKARAQLKRMRHRYARHRTTWSVSVLCMNRMLPVGWIWIMQWLPMKRLKQVLR